MKKLLILACFSIASLNCAAASNPPLRPKELSLPSGRECPLQCQGSPRLDAAFLIWQSKMWGFEFAGKSMIPTASGPSSVTLEEKIFVPDFAWRPGFKINLGYDFSFDGWSLDARWTFYKGEDTMLKKHFTQQIQPTGMGIVPLWFYPFFQTDGANPIRFSDGSMKWRNYFNSIDLELGKCSFLSNRLTMKLFGGLKGAWIRQYYRVRYENGAPVSAIFPGSASVHYTPLESTIACKNKTIGGGLRAGIESKWNLGWKIGLIADASLSLLYSKIETSRDQNDLNLNEDSEITEPYRMKMTTSSHQLKPAAETKLGLDWKMCLGKKSLLGLLIAYELQYFWAQNELRRNYSQKAPGGMFLTNGDLQMHGLTAEASYGY